MSIIIIIIIIINIIIITIIIILINNNTPASSETRLTLTPYNKSKRDPISWSNGRPGDVGLPSATGVSLPNTTAADNLHGGHHSKTRADTYY